MRIGFSKDIHELVSGRKLMLGGIDIPSDLGEKAHSDGDVLLHAIGESILGALALGDLGTHFPDSDPKYKDISSEILVKEILKLADAKGYRVNNVDTFICLESPKIKSFIPAIQENVAKLLNVCLEKVSIKAGTNEKMGPVGERRAIEAYSIITMIEK